jgi:hypothetical protein
MAAVRAHVQVDRSDACAEPATRSTEATIAAMSSASMRLRAVLLGEVSVVM